MCSFLSPFFAILYQSCFEHPSSQDLVLCRRFRGLERKIASRPDDVKCGVKYWTGAWEVEEILDELGA
jgi:hypothetical protein